MRTSGMRICRRWIELYFMAKLVRQKTAEDSTSPWITAPTRGRKGSKVEKDGMPCGAGCRAAEDSCQNSGRRAHWRASDSKASASNRKDDSFPVLWSKIESISAAN